MRNVVANMTSNPSPTMSQFPMSDHQPQPMFVSVADLGGGGGVEGARPPPPQHMDDKKIIIS